MLRVFLFHCPIYQYLSCSIAANILWGHRRHYQVLLHQVFSLRIADLNKSSVLISTERNPTTAQEMLTRLMLKVNNPNKEKFGSTPDLSWCVCAAQPRMGSFDYGGQRQYGDPVSSWVGQSGKSFCLSVRVSAFTACSANRTRAFTYLGFVGYHCAQAQHSRCLHPSRWSMCFLFRLHCYFRSLCPLQ